MFGFRVVGSMFRGVKCWGVGVYGLWVQGLGVQRFRGWLSC